ncbi:MAG TPA: prolyl oligopeptidase family serine peptidase, partial [Acidobacteriota bacterium]|nr:prolyl oligopeptidase family serine peptidase [Acidobacteriota bacterium]
ESSREHLRASLTRSLGLDNLPSPSPLKAHTVGLLDRNEYLIEKVIYQTLPGVFVPAHLYLPADLEDPAPGVILYPGHWLEDSKARPDFQAFCINMAKLGFVVLTFDPFGQGERGISWRDHRRTCSLLVGVAQQGFAAYETQCAIEYLLSRPEVDSRRLGMTGASGGGYNTWMTAALDDRIKVAVPVVGTSEFLEQIRVCRPLDWYHANDHCHFVPGLIRYCNNHELVAMVAPKPLLIVAARDDESFPIRGVRLISNYAKDLYRSFGVPERSGFYEDASAGHGYQIRKREAAYGWFLRWLAGRGDGGPYSEPPTETAPYDAPELRCFPVGENRGAGPGMVDYIKECLRLIKPDRDKNRLTEIFGGFPEPPDFDLRLEEDRRVQRLEIPTENHLSVPAYLVRSGDNAGLLVVVSDNGKEAAISDPLVKKVLSLGWAVCGVDPRGVGELRTDEMGWVFAVSLLLGENFVWRQAWDIGRSIDVLTSTRTFGSRPVVVFGKGNQASMAVSCLLAQYSCRSDSPLSGFVLRDAFISYRHFVDRPISMKRSFRLASDLRTAGTRVDIEIPFEYFPFNVLRHFDLPDIFSLPGIEGVVINPRDGDWNLISEERAGRLLGDKIQVISGVPEADSGFDFVTAFGG